MELLVGMFAAWGAVMLLWTLAGAALLPLSRRKGRKLTVLLQGRESAKSLDRWLRGMLWLRDMGLLWWRVGIVADQLGEEARRRAEAISAEARDVSVITMERLKDWMEE